MSYAIPGFESKICPPALLTARAGLLARPLVFTNGCFDILHRGHVTYLAQAAALGASLVVALNSDASVSRQGKGDDRPVNALEDRLAVMAALGCVTRWSPGSMKTPRSSASSNAGRRFWSRAATGRWTRSSAAMRCIGWGGTVHSIPFLHQKSTTALLEKIRRL